MVDFFHSFEDGGCQDMCAVKLRPDLTGSEGDPVVLFRVSDAPWAVPVPFAKAEFGLDGDIYFSDVPCAIMMENGSLAIIWSDWGKAGYAVGVAVSGSGTIFGPWRQKEVPLVPGGAGHGMVFTALDGKRYYALHSPNDKYLERPVFRELMEENGKLSLNNQKLQKQEENDMTKREIFFVRLFNSILFGILFTFATPIFNGRGIEWRNIPLQLAPLSLLVW